MHRKTAKQDMSLLDRFFQNQKQSCLPPYVNGWKQLLFLQEFESVTRAITGSVNTPSAVTWERGYIGYNGNHSY